MCKLDVLPGGSPELLNLATGNLNQSQAILELEFGIHTALMLIGLPRTHFAFNLTGVEAQGVAVPSSAGRFPGRRFRAASLAVFLLNGSVVLVGSKKPVFQAGP